jgi:hypothetical protein
MQTEESASLGGSRVNRKTIRMVFLLLLASAVAFFSILWTGPSDIFELNLSAGNVAPQDIQAPFAVTYTSEVLTERQRAAAAAAVAPVYSPPDTRIARQQADAMRATLTFITSVRADQFASDEEKLADLMLVENGAISGDTALAILDLSSEQWQIVQQEVVLVLQQVMQSAIRPDQVADALRSIPALVSLTIPDTQADIVAELASLYVAPNSFFSEELTEANRFQAAENVVPVERRYVAGETVVSRGQVLQPEDIEALEQMGLLNPQDSDLNAIKAGLTVVIVLAVCIIFFYREPELLATNRQQVFVAGAFFLFLIVARFTIIGHVVLPFIFPLAAFALLLASLYSGLPGLILPIPLAVLVTFGLPNALELILYYATSSIFAVLLLGHSQRIISFFWAGVGAASIGSAVVVANRLLDPTTDVAGLTTLIGAALVYGVTSAGLAVLLQFFAAQWLGKTTNLQLVELSRPDHPLLRFILLNAPGTYQHSLQVANLAEQAAEQIGANPLLTRVGALYHDCGKALNPQYFIENQIPDTPNLHDSLTAEDSARVIIEHVTKGEEVARKHRLPKAIIAFILEHHGTTMTRYQYGRAINEAGGDASEVDPEKYIYPGPVPQTRETALVMLADGSEARTRAERPPTEHALRELIKDTIDTRIAEHQLDRVHLTPRDLNIILEIFTSTLKGVYHPRLEYPSVDQRTIPVPDRQRQTAPVAVPENIADES